MATTDHPIVLDLGKVTGLSVYEEWLKQDGNEGKTFQEFLEEIANLGVQINVTDLVEEDNPDAVSSRGVWNKLVELGLIGDERKSPVSGSAADRVLVYSLGDALAPEDGEDLTDWIDSAAGTNNIWTVSPEVGQEWHIDNGGHEERGIVLALPPEAATGDRVSLFFRPSGELDECADVTVSAGSVVEMGEAAPNVIGGVSLDCVMSKFGWIVVRHYAEGEEEVVIISRAAKIVYSGANHASQASTTYNTNVTWSGTEETIASSKSTALRSDIFRKLYNLAPFRGWTTRKTSNTVTHSDGQTVSLVDNQTLTLYPLYTETDKSVRLGVTSEQAIIADEGSGGASKTHTYTFNPASYIPGFKGEPYKITIYGWVTSGENRPSSIKYRFNNGSWANLVSQNGLSTASATKTHDLSGTGSITIKFQVDQAEGHPYAGTNYKCYVNVMKIK